MSYKRGRDDEDDYDGGRRHKHTQTTHQIFDRLYFDIVEIGDPSRMSLTNRVAQAGFGFAQDLDNLAIRNGVLETFIATIMEQPHKTPLVAAIVVVANSSNGLAGQLAVEHLHSKIEAWLKAGNYNAIKIAVRLLACLEGVIEDGRGVLAFLDRLLDRAIEEDAKNDIRNPLVEELYAAIFLTLPYVGSTLLSLGRGIEACDTLLEKANNHFGKDKFASNPIVEPYTGEDTPYACDLFLANLYEGVNTVANNGWAVKSFINVADLIEPVVENKEAPKHVFPAVSIPETLASSTSTDYIYPRVFFRAYMPIDVEGETMSTVPDPKSYDAVLWRDMLSDTIQHLDFNRKECAKQLFTLDLFLAPGTFTGPGISVDKLSGKLLDAKADDRSISTLKVEDVASEAILAELFRLATPPLQPAYFHSLFIEACIMAPQAIAPVFGRAVRFLFANLRAFDTELIHRFLDWFSHHLSNFGFTWKWQEWVEFVDLDALDPRLVFMKQLIKKELRLSFESRIKETLPDELVVFVPQDGELMPAYEYIESENQYREVADQLLDVFKDKYDLGASEAYLEVLDAVKEAVPDNRELFLDIVIGAAIFVGSRSLSLSQDWISRLAQQLQHVIESAEDEAAAVTTVMQFYRNQPHVGTVVLHFLLLENVISPAAIIQWLFESPGDIVFTENHGWECLIRTLDEVAQEGEVQDHVGPFKSVFEYLAPKEADAEQLAWWKRQVTKSLVRKYVDYVKHEQILEVVPPSVKDIVEQYLAVRPVVPVKKVAPAEPEVQDETMTDAAAEGVTEGAKDVTEAEAEAEADKADKAEDKDESKEESKDEPKAEDKAEEPKEEPKEESKEEKDETMQE
ncbi:Nuclear cap-binding protein subunit 1 [Yarrowia sp. B02]|nr:Nuclear cap-binding protein subunit 1 [Yarrowia sp. B02]